MSGASDRVGVAVLGGDATIERLRDADATLELAPVDGTEAVDAGGDHAVAAVDPAGEHHCLVIDAATVEDPVAAVTALRDRSDALPVFVLTAELEVELAVLDAGATGRLPPLDGDETAGVVARRLWRAGEAYREERRRERNSAMFESLLESIPASVYFKDREGRHLRVSRLHVDHPDRGDLVTPDGEVITTEEGYVGKTDLDLFPQELAEQSYADDMRIVEEEGEIVNQVEKVPHETGGQHWVTTTKRPWYDANGEVCGVFGFTYQITQRKFRELQLERQKDRIEEFVEVVSHDLRNPLSVAKGHVELAMAEEDAADLSEASAALARIEELLEDLRTIARHGSAVEDLDAVALDEAVDRAWQAVSTGAATLENDCEDAVIGADDARLRQLVENLFRNAVEHGGPDVTVRVGLLEGGFVVEDDGPGIPADQREQVFEHGFSTGEDGTGFGLSIVESIASAHGWDISVAESADGGARFEITDVSSPSEAE